MLEKTIARLAMAGLSRPIAASGMPGEVVAQGPGEVLLDRPQGRAREPDGVGGGAQVTGDEREVRGFDGDDLIDRARSRPTIGCLPDA